MYNIEELIKYCQKNNSVYIYGAGKNAGVLYRFLTGHDISVNGFFVTSQTGNPSSIEGIPVFQADKHSPKEGELILCSILYHRPGYLDIIDHIIHLGWKNVIFFSQKMFAPIRNWGITKTKPQGPSVGSGYYIDSQALVENDHSVLVMEQGDGRYRWRVEDRTLEDDFSDLSKVFPEKSALEEFTELYGPYHTLESTKDLSDIPMPNIQIYMTRSHVDHPASVPDLPGWISPIQVGAALAKKPICDIRDDQGDNISNKNNIYSEATALYWMWKNAPQTDYIGLYHYRRHIAIPGQDVRLLVANHIDILVTIPTFAPNGLRKIFSRLIPQSDIEILQHVIQKNAPEYYPHAQQFFSSRFYPPCNIAIMRDGIFRAYAAYLFPITFAVESFYQERGINRDDRYMGFLVECLLGIFLLRHRDEYHIAYADMMFYSAED